VDKSQSGTQVKLADHVVLDMNEHISVVVTGSLDYQLSPAQANISQTKLQRVSYNLLTHVFGQLDHDKIDEISGAIYGGFAAGQQITTTTTAGTTTTKSELRTHWLVGTSGKLLWAIKNYHVGPKASATVFSYSANNSSNVVEYKEAFDLKLGVDFLMQVNEKSQLQIYGFTGMNMDVVKKVTKDNIIPVLGVNANMIWDLGKGFSIAPQFTIVAQGFSAKGTIVTADFGVKLRYSK